MLKRWVKMEPLSSPTFIIIRCFEFLLTKDVIIFAVSPARCRENKYARTAGAVRACSMTIAVISPPRRVLDLGSHLRVVVGGAV